MIHDLAIIGAGPIGLFASYFAGLHGLSSIVYESLNNIGGQPQKLYPFKDILDIPGFTKISGRELIDRLRKAAQSKIVTNHRVGQIKRKKGHFIIDENDATRAVLITTGNGSFHPKKFPVKFANNHKIHYFVQNPRVFAGQKLAVFGGGDSALDWTLELAKYAQVTLIHRRNKFRGLEANVSKIIQNKNVRILTPYLPVSGKLEQGKIQIFLKKVGSSDKVNAAFNNIIVAYGLRADNSFAKSWGVKLTGTKIAVDQSMSTNVKGIYAAGDAVYYPERVPLIGLGFGEVQMAITSLMRTIFPDKTLTIHSTSI